MDKVTAIRLVEPSVIDTTVVLALKRSMGERRCRTAVDGIIFEITDALCTIERTVVAGTRDGLQDQIDRLRDLANQVGLVCMVDVSADLMDCLERGDDIALAAVAHRLVRLGEDGLFALIEFTDRSIV